MDEMKMTNYDELYYLIMEKNEEAERILYAEVEKYLKWLCFKKANDFLRKEDILSYGWQGYIEALDAYEPMSPVTFKSFLHHCIDRRLIDVQRKRNKQTLKGHMSSLLISEEKVMYVVEARNTTHVNDMRLTLRQFWHTLSNFERRIFRLYIQGVKTNDIAHKLGVSSTTVYKTIKNIRERLSKEL
jgi:RNA polymerase sporulation-specific sigma factor